MQFFDHIRRGHLLEVTADIGFTYFDLNISWVESTVILNQYPGVWAWGIWK